MPSFAFSKSAQRFRYTSGDKKGQFVSKVTVRGLMESFIANEEVRAGRITANLLNGGITLSEWEEGMARRIKAAHSTAYLLGKGGTLRYDSAKDRGRLGALIKSEYKFLRGFTEDIKAGKLTEAQIKARAKSYMAAVYASEQRAEEYGHKDQGYKYEENILTAGENCVDCVFFTSKGVVPIGEIPPIGQDRQCQKRCRCHKDFYKDKPEESGRSLLSSWGWCA